MTNLHTYLDIGYDSVSIAWPDGDYSLTRKELVHLRRFAETHREQVLVLSELWSMTLGHCPSKLVRENRVNVLIRVAADANEHLEILPWEWMIEPNLDLPLSCHPEFIVSRGEPGARIENQGGPTAKKGVLRVLMIDFGFEANSAIDEPSTNSRYLIRDSLENLPNLEFLETPGQDLFVGTQSRLLRNRLEEFLPQLVFCHSGRTTIDLGADLPQLLNLFLHLPEMPILFVEVSSNAKSSQASRWRRLYSIFSRLGVPSFLGVPIPAPGEGPFMRRLFSALCRGDSLGDAAKSTWQSVALEAEDELMGSEAGALLYTCRPSLALVSKEPPSTNRSVDMLQGIRVGLPSSPFKLRAFTPMKSRMLGPSSVANQKFSPFSLSSSRNTD